MPPYAPFIAGWAIQNIVRELPPGSSPLNVYRTLCFDRFQVWRGVGTRQRFCAAFPRFGRACWKLIIAPFSRQSSKIHWSLVLVARPVGIELISSHLQELNFENISSTYLGLLGSSETDPRFLDAGSVVSLRPMLALCRPCHPSCIPRPPHGSVDHIRVLPDRERGSGT